MNTSHHHVNMALSVPSGCQNIDSVRMRVSLQMRRQQRKLNFLITQTELYAHFMARKMNSGSQDDDVTAGGDTQAILSRLDDASAARQPGSAQSSGLVDMVADDYGALSDGRVATEVFLCCLL